MMTNLIEKVKEENRKELEKTIERIKDVESCSIKYYLTDLRNNQLAKGEISREKAEEIAIKKAKKEYAKSLEEKLHKIEEIEKADDFISCTINVEFSRGSMGAWQAKAELMGCGYIVGTKTSGCGYDKESTAVAEVLNQCKPLMKLLYKYRSENADDTLRNVFGYGCGYYTIPCFESGVGVSCYPTILEKVGCSFKCVASGKKFSVFEIRKEK